MSAPEMCKGSNKYVMGYHRELRQSDGSAAGRCQICQKPVDTYPPVNPNRNDIAKEHEA